MLSFGMLPYKLGAILLVVVTVAFGSFGYGYGSGKAAAMKASQARERQQTRLLLEANETNRALERAHEQHTAELRASLARENAKAAAEDAAVIEQLRTGVRRLRVATARCDSKTEPSPGGTTRTGTAELETETSAALWGIAGDGDRAIRKLTALQDWAVSATKLCGDKP